MKYGGNHYAAIGRQKTRENRLEPLRIVVFLHWSVRT